MEQEKGALAAAMALFQGGLAPLKPIHKADIPTKKGGRIVYMYAEMADVLDHVRTGLSENGLAITQSCTYVADRLLVQMKIMHISGEEEIGYFPVDAEGDMRALGSAVTYAKRYLAVAMLGVSISGDDDNASAAVDRRAPSRDRNKWANDEKNAQKYIGGIRACKDADELRDWWLNNSEGISELNPDQVATIKDLVSRTNKKLGAVDAKQPAAKTDAPPASTQKPQSATEAKPAPAEKPAAKPKTAPEAKPAAKPQPTTAPPPHDDAPPPETAEDEFSGAFD